jgi:hypothetical protein
MLLGRREIDFLLDIGVGATDKRRESDGQLGVASDARRVCNARTPSDRQDPARSII